MTFVQTDPRPDNLRAIRCYRACGFQPTGLVDTPDGVALLLKKPRDAHVMARRGVDAASQTAAGLGPVLLRTATPDDAPAVARVLIESRRAFLPFAPSAHGEDDVRDWVRTTLVPGGRVIVCEMRGVPVGVLATSVDGGTGWIDPLYLLPGYTGRGLGRALLARAIDTPADSRAGECG